MEGKKVKFNMVEKANEEMRVFGPISHRKPMCSKHLCNWRTT